MVIVLTQYAGSVFWKVVDSQGRAMAHAPTIYRSVDDAMREIDLLQKWLPTAAVIMPRELAFQAGDHNILAEQKEPELTVTEFLNRHWPTLAVCGMSLAGIAIMFMSIRNKGE